MILIKDNLVLLESASLAFLRDIMTPGRVCGLSNLHNFAYAFMYKRLACIVGAEI